jgi:hypothetical protein
MYEHGLGLEQNYAEAITWYRRAAEQGEAAGEFNLGGMYAHGLGVAQDDAEAAKWYSKAADQGDAVSQFSLGVAYARGLGVARDYVLAHMWLTLSAAQGFGEAKKARDELTSRMTAAELAKAQALAAGWKPKS